MELIVFDDIIINELSQLQHLLPQLLIHIMFTFHFSIVTIGAGIAKSM